MSKYYRGLGVFFVAVFLMALSCMVSGAKVSLNLVAQAGLMYAIPVEGMAKEYMKRNPNIEIIVESLPYEQAVTRIALDVAGGGGTYDLIWVDYKFLGGYVRSNYLLSLEKYLSKDPEFRADIEADYVSIQLQSNVWEGELYGIPIYTDSTMMYYRTDVLAKAGVEKPTNYDELLEICPKIHNPPKMFAIGGHYQRFWAADAWYAILWPLAGPLWDENYVPHLDSPAALKATNIFKEVVKWAPEDALTWDEGLVNDAMGSVGIIAIAPNTWSSTVAADSEKFKFASVVKPSTSPAVDGTTKWTSALGGYALSIGKFSPHADEAWEFLRWMTARENQELYLGFGAHPSRISILTSPVAIAKDPSLPVLVEAMKRAKARPRIPEFAQVEQLIGVELDKIIIGEKEVKETLQDMNEAIYDVMKETGRIKE